MFPLLTAIKNYEACDASHVPHFLTTFFLMNSFIFISNFSHRFDLISCPILIPALIV